MIPKQAIIIGGGASIQDGIALGLKEKLQNKFVVACNFAWHHFTNTFTIFLDNKVWTGHLLGKDNPYIDTKHVEIIKQQKLLVASDRTKIKNPPANMIVLKKGNKYNREKSLTEGFYVGHFTGIFALSVVSFLMNYTGQIFILGFDWTKQPKDGSIPITHYYKEAEINHRGQHRVNNYNTMNPDDKFKYFLEPNLKIYNVSPNSNIKVFEKINYKTMFELLNNKVVNHNDIREEIKKLIK